MSKKPSTAVAVVKPNAVAKVDNNLPGYLQGYQGATGAEGIETIDLVIPRIKLGQSMTKEVKAGVVKEGELFLNLTQEILAEVTGSLPLVPLWRGKEFILWRPQEDNGGGILARAKPVVENGVTRYKWDKPNSSFEVKVGGKIKVVWKTKEYIDQDGLDQWGSEIPGDAESGIAATAHHNYIVVLPSKDDMVAALSLSKSQVKKAKNFNSLLKLGSAPMWARLFTTQIVDEQRSATEKYKNVDLKSAGFVSEEQFARYSDMAKSFQTKSFVIDQSDEDQGDNGADKRA